MTLVRDMNLIERCRVTPAGHLEAWSIQGRYGAAILATGALLALVFVHQIHAGVRSDGLWALGGLAGLTLLFGAAIARLRQRLRVDEIGIYLDSRSVFRTDSWFAPRACARRIVISEVAESTGDSTSIFYDVLLDVSIEDTTKEIRVFRSRAEIPARNTGAEVSRSLDLPIVDAIGDKEEEIELEAPDGSLTSRSIDTGPPPDRVYQDPLDSRNKIVITGTTPPHIATHYRIAGTGFLVMSTLMSLAIANLMDPAWLGALIPFPFWGAALYFLICAWAGENACECVSIEQGVVARHVEWLGRKWKRTALEARSLQRLRIQTKSASKRGIAMVYAEQTVVVGEGLEAADIDWLHAWLVERTQK